MSRFYANVLTSAVDLYAPGVNRSRQRPLGDTKRRYESEERYEARMALKAQIASAPTHVEERDGRTFTVRVLPPPESSR